jgi:hypothetical protein
MNGNIQHKLLHYEIVPPQGVWERIAVELDANEASPKPATETIDKLISAEITPPAGLWEQISNRLGLMETEDAKPSPNTITSLFNYEIAPPEGLWKEISGELDILANKHQPAPVIAMPARRRPLARVYKLAAAAVVTGILLTSALLIWNNRNNNPGSEIVKNQSAVDTNPAITQPGNNIKNPNPVFADTDTPSDGGTDHTDENESPFLNRTPEESNTYIPGMLAQLDKQPVNKMLTDISSRIGQLESSSGIIERDILISSGGYETITGPNGQPVRVSGKVANMVRMINTEDAGKEGIDLIIEQSGYWKTKFNQWKQKAADPRFIPSANNFFDIAEFVELVK